MLCAILACFHALILARRNLLAIVCEVINLRKLILNLHSIVCFSLCIFVKCHSSNCGGGGEREEDYICHTDAAKHGTRRAGGGELKPGDSSPPSHVRTFSSLVRFAYEQRHS